MEQTIEKLKDSARRSWNGETGERRAEKLEKYLRAKLTEYSTVLDIPQAELLSAWEEKRTYSAINYYQESNQPTLSKEKVRVFDNVDNMLEAVGEKEFRCPACEGVSTNPYECNSGMERDDVKVCDWKTYGLFGDLGEGVYIYIKDKMAGETIFKPLSWET